MAVGVTEAKKRLTQLIRAVEQGESVVVTRNGKPQGGQGESRVVAGGALRFCGYGAALAERSCRRDLESAGERLRVVPSARLRARL